MSIFDRALIEFLPNSPKDACKWRVTVDGDSPLEMIDLANVIGYISVYPWPSDMVARYHATAELVNGMADKYNGKP